MAIKRRGSRRQVQIASDIDMKPCMSLFTILIPFLVACAAFASIKIIDLDLPETRVDKPVEQKEKIEEGLLLTVFVTDKGLALAAKGARESLVLMDGLALVVSVANRTVITAVGTDRMTDQIFTNIDSAAVR